MLRDTHIAIVTHLLKLKAIFFVLIGFVKAYISFVHSYSGL